MSKKTLRNPRQWKHPGWAVKKREQDVNSLLQSINYPNHVLNLQINSASGCSIKNRFSQDCCKNFFGQTIESEAKAFQSLLTCRLIDPSWQHSIRESRTYFNMFRPMYCKRSNSLTAPTFLVKRSTSFCTMASYLTAQLI